MNLQHIEKNGKRFVLVPDTLFNRLAKAAAALEEIERFDSAMANLGTLIPGEVFHRVLKGENPVKVYREWRGLTQAQLAARIKVSRAMVTQIESGAKTGRLETMKAIARALDVDLDDLA